MTVYVLRFVHNQAILIYVDKDQAVARMEEYCSYMGDGACWVSEYPVLDTADRRRDDA